MTLRSAIAGLILAAGLILPSLPASAALSAGGSLADLTDHPARSMTETTQFYYERPRRYYERRWGSPYEGRWGPPRRARTICRYEPRRVFNPRNGRSVVRQVEVCRRRW